MCRCGMAHHTWSRGSQGRTSQGPSLPGWATLPESTSAGSKELVSGGSNTSFYSLSSAPRPQMQTSSPFRGGVLLLASSPRRLVGDAGPCALTCAGGSPGRAFSPLDASGVGRAEQPGSGLRERDPVRGEPRCPAWACRSGGRRRRCSTWRGDALGAGLEAPSYRGVGVLHSGGGPSS